MLADRDTFSRLTSLTVGRSSKAGKEEIKTLKGSHDQETSISFFSLVEFFVLIPSNRVNANDNRLGQYDYKNN